MTQIIESKGSDAASLYGCRVCRVDFDNWLTFDATGKEAISLNFRKAFRQDYGCRVCERYFAVGGFCFALS